MKKKIITILLLSSGSFYQCAKFVPPTGGEKDITPPQLKTSIPANKSINYTKKEIELTFDEMVNINNLKQELLVTPALKTKYKVKSNGSNVKIEFENTLDTNTTYTLNFRKGIKDLNEGNTAANLKLVFSTGKYIDSLKLNGKVEDLFTKKNQFDITVGLYDTETFDTLPILKRKPTYFVKTDSSGVFQFENIKNKPYQLIYFTDKNSNLLFEERKEKFGFKKETIRLDSNNQLPSLSVYPYDTTAPKIKRQLSRESNFLVQFDEDVENINIVFPKNKPLIPYIHSKNELILFRPKSNAIDSLDVTIIVTDSLANKGQYQQLIKFATQQYNSNSKKIGQIIKITPIPIQNKNLRKIEPIVLNFNQPIEEADTTKIKVTDDTLRAVKYQLRWLDESKSKLEIRGREEIKKSILIEVKAGAFKSISGDTCAAFKLSYPLIKKEESGIIEGRVGEEPDTQNYIVQLIKESNWEVIEEQMTDANFLFEKVLPDTYLLRVIEDTNKNNKWDTGNFYKGEYPEKVYVHKTAIKVKENFEIRDIKITPKN